MDNAEKLATQVTQNKEKNQKQKTKKTNTMCVRRYYPQAKTNNVNKT
jgi:hypothetical protein